MDLSKTISMDELLKQVEGEERFSRWYEIDQSRIDGFVGGLVHGFLLC